MQMRSAWGKFDEESGSRHHLAHHCADVAAVFRCIMDIRHFRDNADRALGRPISEGEIACLTAVCFLHDIGKIAPAFQVIGWPEETRPRPMGHLKCGMHWLSGLQEHSLDGQVKHLANWGDDCAKLWLEAAFAHHGKPLKNSVDEKDSGIAFRPLTDYSWKADEALLGQALIRWFPGIASDRPPPATPRLVHYVSGLFALADWIGSDQKAFEFRETFDPNYWEHALLVAKRQIAAIAPCIDKTAMAGPANWNLISSFDEPLPAQAVVGDLPTSEPLVILESETGSGKTEAALWRFAKLLEADEVSALYFALPTRAAARQLHGRVNAAMMRMFRNPPEAILAIPGQRVSGEATGVPLPGFEVLWDDGPASAKRWAAEHANRFLAARIGIGTVDQAMLAGLRAKHAHMRGSLLSRALLVIDEVHASDPWMSAIQKSLVDDQLALDGHVMLMSATLGVAARSLWTNLDTPSLHLAQEISYPAVWMGRNPDPVPIPTYNSRQKAVQVTAMPGWDANQVAKEAASAARNGARVLVIRNTVARAQKTWAACMDQVPDLVMGLDGKPCLHHSRYAAEDRQRLDDRVEHLLGKEAPMQGVIVIGTQTLEQSLDLSADILLTDLCPMDVLLQRIGRLQRHQEVARTKAFAEPVCLVFHPQDGLGPLVSQAENGLGVYSKPGSISGIYMDVCSLQATLEAIREKPNWIIPEMNRCLVESATHPQALDRVAEEQGWQKHRTEILGKVYAEWGGAGLYILDRTKPLAAFPEDEAVLTRIGDDGIVLELPDGTIGPFGTPIRRLGLPSHLSWGLEPETLTVENIPEGLRMVVSDRAFEYRSSGLHKGCRNAA